MGDAGASGGESYVGDAGLDRRGCSKIYVMATGARRLGSDLIKGLQAAKVFVWIFTEPRLRAENLMRSPER